MHILIAFPHGFSGPCFMSQVTTCCCQKTLNPAPAMAKWNLFTSWAPWRNAAASWGWMVSWKIPMVFLWMIRRGNPSFGNTMAF